MTRRPAPVNWFTVASMLSLCAMVVLGVIITVTDHSATLGDIVALIILGFAATVAAVFSIHDTIAREFHNRREVGGR